MWDRNYLGLPVKYGTLTSVYYFSFKSPAKMIIKNRKSTKSTKSKKMVGETNYRCKIFVDFCRLERVWSLEKCHRGGEIQSSENDSICPHKT